jgi:hypothetical protein
MRQRLFTKEIDNKLFAQYKYGSDLSKQMVVAKIFNPFNRGQWYIINSDPNDPDYLWAIVDLFEIEAGSVSREDLQTIKVPPFGLNLERDLYFQPINAQELYDRLRQGERFEHGGSVDVIQNDKDESYLTSVNAKPTDAAIKLADGGEVSKSWGVMFFKEGKNRFGEKIESAFNNTRVQGTLKEAIEKVKEELVGNISYATIKDRSIGDVLVAKVKQDGTINIYREGYWSDKMAKGGMTFKDRSEYDSVKLSKEYQKVIDSDFDKNAYENYKKIVKETKIPKESLEKIEHYVITTPKGKRRDIDIYQYWSDKMAKGGTTKSYTYVPKSDIKRILVEDENHNERTINAEDILDGAYIESDDKNAQRQLDKLKEDGFIKKIDENKHIITIQPNKEKKGYYKMYRSAVRGNAILLNEYLSEEDVLEYLKNLTPKKLYAKGGTTKNYEYIPKSNIEEIDFVLNGEERKIFGKRVLDGAYVKKSVPKSNKGKLSERAQGILDSSLESFERQSEKQKLTSIKMVENNLESNKKGIDTIGMGLDEDKVAAGEEFIKIVKSKKYEDKPEIELGTFKEARYAKGKMLYIPPTKEKGAWKGRQERLAEAKGISGKYTHRENGYIMSKSQAGKLKKYILEGYDAGVMTGELVKPQDLYAKGGVTFKDKVKSISNSLKGEKVPSKLKKDYGATYDKKESVLAATRIAGAMKAKMESKKKR